MVPIKLQANSIKRREIRKLIGDQAFTWIRTCQLIVPNYKAVTKLYLLPSKRNRERIIEEFLCLDIGFANDHLKLVVIILPCHTIDQVGIIVERTLFVIWRVDISLVQ